MGNSIQQLSLKVTDIIDDIFRRDDDDDDANGSKKYQESIELTMGLVERLSSLNNGIAIAANSGVIESPLLVDALSPEFVDSIQAQLLESAGKLISFGEETRVRSFYLASNPEDIQLIKGVRLSCQFETQAEPIDLTVVFDEQDIIHYVYLPQANGNVVFSVPSVVINENNETVRTQYLKEFARHIVYELAQGRYKRIEKFFALPHRAGLNLENFVDEFTGCEFSSLQWGSIIITPIADGKQMINLSVSFDRQERQSFEQGLLLIFNDEDMLETIDFFVD